jgi:hypothetical protein
MMREKGPIEFVGEGFFRKNDISIPVTFKGNYDLYSSDPVVLVVTKKSEITYPHGFKVLDETSPTELIGTAQDGDEIWVSCLSPFSKTSWVNDDHITWEGPAELFVKGKLREFDGVGTEIICSLFLTPTVLTNPETSFSLNENGTISFGESSDRRSLCFDTPLGKVELLDNYHYLNEKLGFDDSLLRIRRSTLTLHVDISEKTSIKDLFQKISQELEPYFWLISFLGRDRIIWYSGEILVLPNDENGDNFRRGYAKKERYLKYLKSQNENYWFQLLVKREWLLNDGMNSLVINYLNSSYKDVIRRSIQYLIITYEDSYFDSHLSNIYTALECLVSGLRENANTGPILDPIKFKVIRKELENVILSNLTDESSKKLIERLGNLNNNSAFPPFPLQLFNLLCDYKVDLDNVFPPSSDIPKALEEIHARRNNYIHSAEMADVHKYIKDFWRLQVITELLILKVLDCPDEAMNKSYLSKFGPIDRE